MINSNCGVLYMRIWRQFPHCKFDKNVVTISDEKFEMWLHLSPPSRTAKPKKVRTRNNSLLFHKIKENGIEIVLLNSMHHLFK